MSLSSYALADAGISEVKTHDGRKKVPPKRTVTALQDTTAAPEPR